MFRKALLCSALLLVSSGVLAADAKAKAAAGVWETASGGYVQFYESGGKWQGKIVGSKSGKARYDKNNPDEKERGRRLLGVTIVKGLTYEGDGKFSGGTIYDPDNGKTYSAKATLADPQTLNVRGYIGISLLGKSQSWTPVKEDAPNVHQELLEKTDESQAKAKTDDSMSKDEEAK